MVLEGARHLAIVPELVDRGEEVIGRFGGFEDRLSVDIRDKLAPLVEELERVPILWVVAGGDDDAPVRLLRRDRHLHSRGRRITDV